MLLSPVLQKVSDMREKRSRGDLDEELYRGAMKTAVGENFPLKVGLVGRGDMLCSSFLPPPSLIPTLLFSPPSL